MSAALDSQVLEQLVTSIQAIHSPSVSNAERQSHQQVCDSLKQHPARLLYGFYLANVKSGLSDRIRHFGLLHLESCIQLHWTEFTQEELDFMKNSILDLVREGTHSLLNEKPYIKEKLVRVLVEIMKRLWPVSWVELDVILRKLYNRDPTHQELVLMVYRTLAEDIFLFEDPIAELRKSELLTALTAISVSANVLEQQYSKSSQKQIGKLDLVVLLNMVRAHPENTGWMCRWTESIQMYKETWKRALQSGDTVSIQTTEKLLLALLNTVMAYIDWMLIPALCQARVLDLLLELLFLDMEGVPSTALDCLTILFSRNIPSISQREDMIWKPLFDESRVNLLFTFYCNLYRQSDLASVQQSQYTLELDESQYMLVKKFTQTMIALAEQVTYKKNTSTPSQLASFLDFFSVALDHPSTLISVSYIGWLCELYRHDYLSKSSEALSVLPKVLEACFRRSAKLHPPMFNELAREYDERDFDSAVEISSAVSSLKQRIGDLVRAVSKQKPFDMINWISERIQNTLTLAARSGASDSLYSQLEACTLYVESIFQVLPIGDIKLHIGDLQNQSLIAVVCRMIELLLDFKTNETRDILSQLQLLAVLGAFLDLIPTLLPGVLQKLFAYVTFELEKASESGPVRERGLSIRRRASSGLVKIASAIPDTLMTIFDQIMGFVAQVLGASQMTKSERTLLYEFLLVLVYNSNRSDPGVLFDTIMGPVLQNDVSSLMQDVSSAETFFRFTGIPTLQEHSSILARSPLENALPADLQSALSKNAEARSFLRGAVMTIWHALRQFQNRKNKVMTNHAWQRYVGHIIPFLLASIQQMHGLYNAKVQSRFPVLVGISTMTLQEKRQIIGLPPSEDRESIIKSVNHLDQEILLLRNWVIGIREATYNALALCAQVLGPAFYEYPQIGPSIVTSLFQDASSLTNQFWKSLINGILQPLLLYCPKDSFSVVLSPFLSPFFSFISQRLEAEWKSVIIRDEEDVDATSDVISDEIVNEKLVRDLTRSLVSLLTSIFQPIAASAKKDIAQQVTALKHPELVEFLVTSDAAQPLFRTILSCLSFKDAFSTGRLLIVLNTLTPILSKSPAFDELLGKQVLMGALEVVHDGYKKECHSEAILLITDIYATLGLRQCSFPRETFAVLPGMTKEKLEEFERQILAPSQDLTTSGSHTSKERLAATKALLSSITGLELSRLFTKKTPSFVLDLAQKQLLLSKPESDSQRCNLLMDQGESSANLEGLFDE